MLRKKKHKIISTEAEKKYLIKFNPFSSWKTLKKLEIKRETPTYSNPAKTQLLLALCVDNQITYNNLEFGFFISSSHFFCFSFYLFHEPIKALSRSHPYEHPGLPPAFKGKPFHDLPFFPLAVPWGLQDFPCGSAGKESACNVGDLGLIPGLGRSPGGGNGYPLQYSGLENSTDYIVYGVAKSRMWLSDFHFWHWKYGVLTTRSPGKSLPLVLMFAECFLIDIFPFLASHEKYWICI